MKVFKPPVQWRAGTTEEMNEFSRIVKTNDRAAFEKWMRAHSHNPNIIYGKWYHTPLTMASGNPEFVNRLLDARAYPGPIPNTNIGLVDNLRLSAAVLIRIIREYPELLAHATLNLRRAMRQSQTHMELSNIMTRLDLLKRLREEQEQMLAEESDEKSSFGRRKQKSGKVKKSVKKSVKKCKKVRK
jgi:hypothetical protein